MIRLVNFRLIDFSVFDLRRSLSPDLHESCDFKFKNRSLEKPKKAYFMKKAYFSPKQPFSTFLKKIGQNLYFFCQENRQKFTKNKGVQLHF